MNRRTKLWSAILIVAAIVRLLTLSAYPLHDTTEARYAEIARLMLASGDWITPQIEAGLPFWGKPPLSFWLTASSFKLIGLTEFAARLPSFLLLMLVMLLLFRFVNQTLSIDIALGSAAIILTSAIGFVAAGAVMTDAPLLLGTTLSMIAFWRAAILNQRQWRYVFFAGIAIGLLAKGPIAIILTMVPVVLWLLYARNINWSMRCLPWVPGFFLVLLMAAPWYAIAEHKTPGFLEYFLIGEHWLRFTESGWTGDRYGTAHAAPRGSIWLFGLIAALPWSLVAVYAIGRPWRAERTLRNLTPFQAYLTLWMLTPLFVFTFAGNILPAYVLPGIPAFAILLSNWLIQRNSKLLHIAWLVPMVIAVAISSTFVDVIGRKSQKDLIAYHSTLPGSEKLFYFPKRPFSAEFYSRGTALEIRSDSSLASFVETPGTEFIAIRRSRMNLLPAGIESCLHITAVFPRHLLFKKYETGCPDYADAAPN